MKAFGSAANCKTCLAPGVRGASHCGRCGAPRHMPIEHKLLLGGGLLLIVAMFVFASIEPDQADYRPPRPVPEASAAAASAPAPARPAPAAQLD